MLDIQEAKDVYELMDQTQLIRLRQAYKYDLEYNVTTMEGVRFANSRITIIEGILEQRGDNGDR